jgi:hypothetical protein
MMENEIKSRMMTEEEKTNVKEKFNEIKKPKKEKMSQQEAFDLIQEWGDDMETRLVDEDFEAVQEEIWKAVQMERLTFDETEEVFKYVLKKPIKDQGTGQNKYNILYIAEQPLESKKGVSKFKDETDRAAALWKSYCRDSEGNEIAHGFLLRIHDRDANIINAIILGFFLEAVPGPLSQK